MARGTYYQDGFSNGHAAASDTDWQPGEMRRKYEADELGEVAGQILEHWQQMAGTIYYDESVTERQLSAWEEGFYAGFVRGVKDQMKKRPARF